VADYDSDNAEAPFERIARAVVVYLPMLLGD
jgi:hypothetical protein